MIWIKQKLRRQEKLAKMENFFRKMMIDIDNKIILFTLPVTYYAQKYLSIQFVKPSKAF